MKGLLLLLLSLALGILILVSTIQFHSGLKSERPVTNAAVATESVQALAVDEVLEGNGYTVRVMALQRVDNTSAITLNVVVENRSGQDWELTYQNFVLKDRSHAYTYWAQPFDAKNALRLGMIHPGEVRSGALRFSAPLDMGLDFAFNPPTESEAAVIRLIP